ncbi:MAG: flagellar hook-associated protein FlgK [Myxococcales bacterium]
MADIFSLLIQSGSSLSAQSAALATAGHNIANANTPGYSRQIANFAANPAIAAMGSIAVGTGVSLQSVTQARNLFVERQIPTALGAQGYSGSLNAALQSVTALDTDLQGGMTSALGAFYSSLRTLSQNPGDLALRQGVIGSSQALARSFNATVGAIDQARTGLDSEIVGDLAQINGVARSLADLNKQIEAVTSGEGQANDLKDQRQIAVDTLARMTGGTPYANGAGDVSVALPGGTALVIDGAAGQFSAVGDPANGGHLKVRFTRADGSGPVDMPNAGFGGELGGRFAARDGAMKTAISSLDTFAFDLATSVNTIHSAGYAMDGSTLRPLFTIPVAAPGAASQIAVNGVVAADPRLLAAATTLPAASGDNRNILAMVGTESQMLAGGADPVATLQQLVTAYGSSTSQAQAVSEHDAALSTHLSKLRDSETGVSIDEEMINLTKAQKSYEALAKVISTANQMLDTLMSLK